MAIKACTLESNVYWATGGWNWQATNANDSYSFYSGRTGTASTRTYYRSRIRFSTPSYTGTATKIVLKLTINGKSSPRGLMGVLTEKVDLAYNQIVDAQNGGGPASELKSKVISTSSRAYKDEGCTTVDDRFGTDTSDNVGSVTYLKFECSSLKPNTNYDVYIMRNPTTTDTTGYCSFCDNNSKKYENSLTATIHYKENKTLTLKVNTPGSATFTTKSDGKTTITVEEGTSVETKATANEGYWLQKYYGTAEDGINMWTWECAEDGSQPTERTAQWSMKSNRTITLVAPAKVYTINYNKNGATSGTNYFDTCPFNEEFTAEENKFAKKGYTFDSWNTAANGSGDTFVVGETYSLNTANDLTLYAQWEVKNFTVSYNPMGGTFSDGVDNTQTVQYGTTYTPISGEQIRKPGYQFLGWTTNSDGTSTDNDWKFTGGKWEGDQGSEGYAINDEDKVFLYAMWAPYKLIVRYTVGNSEHDTLLGYDCLATYCELNNQEIQVVSGGAICSREYNANEKPMIEPYDGSNSIYMEKTGHIRLNSWVRHTNSSPNLSVSVEEEFESAMYLAEKFGVSIESSDAEVYLCPEWEPEKYEIKFSSNGEVLKSQTKEYGTPVTLLEYIPYKDGHTFLGWGTDESESTVVYQPGSLFEENRNIILYAVWNEAYRKSPSGVYIKENSKFNGGGIYVKINDKSWAIGKTIYFKVNGVWIKSKSDEE
jgi:uncharacterized repeat protein (TIGR02543 family)